MTDNIIPVDDPHITPVAEEGAPNFAAMVKEREPQQKAAFEKMGPEGKLLQYQPFQFGYMPFGIGPAYNKAVDYAEAAAGKGKGNTAAERYADLQAQRAAAENIKYQEYPKTYALSTGIVSGLGAMAMPEMGLAKGATSLAGEGATVLPYMARMGESGLMGAASSEAPPEETAPQAGERLGLGFLGGAAATPVASALTLGAKGLYGLGKKVYGLFDPEAAMASKIVSGAENVGALKPSQRQMTVSEYLDAVDRGDPNISLAYVSGTRPLIESAEQHLPSDPRTGALNDVISERLKQNPAILSDAVDTAAGRKIDINAEREAATKAYRSAAAPAYNKAFNSPGADSVWNPSFNTIINTSEGQQAIDWANNERIKDGILEASPFSKDPNTGLYALRSGTKAVGPELPPDLEYWDYVKRGLNTVAKKQSAVPGEKDTAASTFNMVGDLTDYLRKQFPEYGKALDTAQRYIKADNAFDAGSDFFSMITKPKGNAEDIGNQMNYFTASPKQGGYSDKEKDGFRTGLLSFIKENPDAAASIFKDSDPTTMSRLRTVLGDNTFGDLSDSFRMARVRALTGEFGQTLKNKIPSLITGQSTLPTGTAMGAGAATFAAAEHFPHLAEAVTNPTTIGMASLAALIGVPTYIGAKATVSGLANARAGAMLSMAMDNSPAVQQKLKDALNSSDLNRKIFENLESRITNYMANSPIMNTPANTQRAFGGRVGHASGGKVIRNQAKARSLLNDLKRRRTKIGHETAQMLSLPDDAVVQALDAAKR